jgi:phenylalanyl-tRNA synthetase beta chain
MKISLNWLMEYVPVSLAPKALAERLTMAGLEVEGIARAAEGLENVRVARIQESSPHPNAEKLSVTKVDAGDGRLLQIVCGAKNYQVGDKVPLATVGARLPNGLEIEEATIRGVESFGMLCSAKELGLSADASGLMILDPELRVGTPLAQALALDDTVLEVNVTPNRPDALSHLGIAREVAALTAQAVQQPDPKIAEGRTPASESARVRIEDPDRCPRYAARVIENVKVGPSPRWMANRLESCGIRSINNLVDVTNYVLLEYGHPLHAFDLDKLGGAEIVVRVARPGEKLTTLDGKERALDPDDLVIADRDRAQALAGVMGGGDSEVSAGTVRVLLESAYFQPASIRRTSRRHGLHTEASHRFERGADIDAVPKSLDRAAALIAELAGGTVLAGRIDAYPAKVGQRVVALRPAAPSKLLGSPVMAEEAERILSALGFEKASGGWLVPSWRADVEREEDLIEEIARIRGYDTIASVLPRGPSDLPPEPPEAEVERRIRTALAGAGFVEVVTYSFVAPSELPWTTVRPYSRFGEAVTSIALRNPISAEQSVMRTSMYPGLLRSLSHNMRHQVDSVRLYEWGRTYAPNPKGGEERRPVAIEPLHVAGVLAGLRAGRTWTSPDERIDFFDAKGAVEAVLAVLGISGARFVAVELAPYHPRATAEVQLASGELVGTIGELHPRAAKMLDVPQGAFLFDLDVERLARAAEARPRHRPLTRFPSVLRDIAVVVDAALSSEEVRKVILDAGQPLVEEARIFDVYTGKPIPEGRKNLAFALSYRAEDRTLTDVEVNDAHARIVAEVNRRLGGSLRGENA